MKTNVLISLTLGFLLILCTQSFSLAAPVEDEIVLPNMPRISAEELKQMIDKGADIVIVDTRDGGSYEFGHIKGAVNIYFDLTGDPMDRQMTLIALPMDKLIVTYCD